MKLPVLSFVVFFLSAVFVCFVFIFISGPMSGQARLIMSSQDQGRVLGVSEEGATGSGQNDWKFYNNLPINKDISGSGPQKKEDANDLLLNNCSGVVIDALTGQVLFGQDQDAKQPIASITKLAAALTLMDMAPAWEKVYEVQKEDVVSGGRIFISVGDRVTINDLFYLALVGSDNTAARALVSATGLTVDEFVAKMNKKAQELGLAKTSFVEPVGISGDNVSTAYEIAKLTKAALDNEEISRATLTRSFSCVTELGRKITVKNTDALLIAFPQNGLKILGGKTGFTDAAGYCFAGKFANHTGRELVSVVLGGDGKNDRFTETKRMVEWAYDNYIWQN